MEIKEKDLEKLRKYKLKEYTVFSHVIAVLLLGILFFEVIFKKNFGLISFPPYVFLLFLIVIFLVIRFLNKSYKISPPKIINYIIIFFYVAFITFLICKNVTYNKHVIKVFYLIPIILFTVNYGQKFGLFVAGFSGVNLLLLDFFYHDFVNLDLDIIAIMLFFWVAWLIGGFTELEREIQKYLKKMTKDLNMTNEKLKESQKLFRLNFEETHIGMAIIDLEGNFIKVNRALSVITGYSKKNFMNMNYKKILDKDYISNISNTLEKMKDGKINAINKEASYINKKGDYIWVNQGISLARSEAGRPLYFLNQYENITDKKKAREKIKKQKEELEYNKVKTQFFSKLSHELKTPLNLIFSALQLLNGAKKQEKKIDRYLKLIKQNSYRLLRLVNNVIDLTKMDANSYVLNKENIDIVSLVKQIIFSTKEYLQENQRILEYHSEVKEKVIACDPFNIERIFLNLISNAVKFSNKGDKISVNIYDRDEYILITVKDTGIGIKDDNLNFIFEQFRQVDETFTRKKEGSGIGLSVVKSLVELHNGKVWVESTYGNGSEFFIKLPVSFVEDKKIDNSNITDNLLDKIDVEFSDIYDINDY